MKRLIKFIIIGIESVVAIPLAIVFSILGILASYIDRYSEVSIVISKIPLYLGEIVRLIYYKITLKKSGSKVLYQYGSYVLYRDTQIGNNVRIGYNTIIGSCTIGNDVLIGNSVNILSGKNQHMYNDSNKLIREQKGFKVKIKISNDIWIGNNSIIAANIDDKVVVGIGSIVIKNLEKNAVYVGAPAKKIKNI